MIKEINDSQVGLLKEQDFSVILIYAKGCPSCEATKPVFETFSNNFPEIQFLQAELMTTRNLYEAHAERIKVMQDNVEVEQIKYVIPSIYIFHQAAADDDNPNGFIGGVDGHNPQELLGVLKALQRVIDNG